MIRFLGILIFIFAPLLIAALVVGRKLEDNGVREDRDMAIREGLNALKRRVLTLEKLRSARRERRG
jgi:hypothetical protein